MSPKHALHPGPRTPAHTGAGGLFPSPRTLGALTGALHSATGDRAHVVVALASASAVRPAIRHANEAQAASPPAYRVGESHQWPSNEQQRRGSRLPAKRRPAFPHLSPWTANRHSRTCWSRLPTYGFRRTRLTLAPANSDGLSYVRLNTNICLLFIAVVNLSFA